MKISIYELLGMIKDGKVGDITTNFMFERKEYNLLAFLDEYTLDINSLNWEVEIIGEKKTPEKLTDILRVDDLIPPVDENMYKIWKQTIKNQNKINEICDYLKSKGEDKI